MEYLGVLNKLQRIRQQMWKKKKQIDSLRNRIKDDSDCLESIAEAGLSSEYARARLIELDAEMVKLKRMRDDMLDQVKRHIKNADDPDLLRALYWRIINRKSWLEVTAEFGGKYTCVALRKRYSRYMHKHDPNGLYAQLL